MSASEVFFKCLAKSRIVVVYYAPRGPNLSKSLCFLRHRVPEQSIPTYNPTAMGIPCTKVAHAIPSRNKDSSSSLCHGCQLGCHIRLPFPCPPLMRRVNLILYIVIFEHLLWSLPRDISTIWSFWMISRTTYGRFHCALSLTLFLCSLTSLLM